jgi:hypothetical protein
LLCFANSRLMSSMLSQLIRWEANLVNLGGASTKSCRDVFTIKDNYKEDDGKNDGGIDEPFNNNKDLVAVSAKVGEPTDEAGEEGEPFLVESKKNSIVKTSTVRVSACCNNINCKNRATRRQHQLH